MKKGIKGIRRGKVLEKKRVRRERNLATVTMLVKGILIVVNSLHFF